MMAWETSLYHNLPDERGELIHDDPGFTGAVWQRNAIHVAVEREHQHMTTSEEPADIDYHARIDMHDISLYNPVTDAENDPPVRENEIAGIFLRLVALSLSPCWRTVAAG